MSEREIVGHEYEEAAKLAQEEHTFSDYDDERSLQNDQPPTLVQT